MYKIRGKGHDADDAMTTTTEDHEVMMMMMLMMLTITGAASAGPLDCESLDCTFMATEQAADLQQQRGVRQRPGAAAAGQLEREVLER